MDVKELKKDKVYYYTAGAEWLKVKYLHQTINGYLFVADGVENVLTKQSISQYIESV